MKAWTVAIAVLSLFFLAHCGSVRISPGHADIAGFDPTALDGKKNLAALEKRYGAEWKEIDAANPHPPKVGIALSGGGLRSATFSLGVLRHLGYYLTCRFFKGSAADCDPR